MSKSRFLVFPYPAQGHINPAFQFAKRLVSNGALVTIVTTTSAFRRISKSSNSILPDGLSFSSFSDGQDDGFISFSRQENLRYQEEFKRRGTQLLAELIQAHGDGDGEQVPFTCLIYTLLLPWAAKVAAKFNLPSALLWLQPALVFDVYYYSSNGYRKEIAESKDKKIMLPGLPPLEGRDLPSFVLPSNEYAWLGSLFEDQIQALNDEENPIVLVNTFEPLELEALTAIPNLKMLAVGPLVPSSIVDEEDKSFRVDMFHGSEDYKKWLDGKPKNSVVYISFGTLAILSKPQLEEIARALIEIQRPILWTITRKLRTGETTGEEDNLVDYKEELQKQGLIVSWCAQVEVLLHPAVGCFVTHCGWNSTLESLACGVPTVAFPQWSDQGTNAMMIDAICETGVRVVENEDGMVESAEVKRCVELVMREKAEEFRKNAKRWRDLTLEASRDGGSQCKNLQAFMQMVAEGHTLDGRLSKQ